MHVAMEPCHLANHRNIKGRVEEGKREERKEPEKVVVIFLQGLGE